MATIIEAPDVMQQTQSIASVQSLCSAQGVPIAGNAVGNTQDFLNCSGQITVPPKNHGYAFPSDAMIRSDAMW